MTAPVTPDPTGFVHDVLTAKRHRMRLVCRGGGYHLERRALRNGRYTPSGAWEPYPDAPTFPNMREVAGFLNTVVPS